MDYWKEQLESLIDDYNMDDILQLRRNWSILLCTSEQVPSYTRWELSWDQTVMPTRRVPDGRGALSASQ